MSEEEKQRLKEYQKNYQKYYRETKKNLNTINNFVVLILIIF